MKIYRAVFVLFSFSTLFFLSACGERKTEGRAVDASGKPVAGVEVKVLGREGSVLTDNEGQFYLPFVVEKSEKIVLLSKGSWPQGCLFNASSGGSDSSLIRFSIPCFRETDENGAAVFLSQDRKWVDNGKDVVSDISRKLMWQRNDNSVKVPWWRAARYCDELELAGFSDWSLPSSEALSSTLMSRNSSSVNPFFVQKRIRYWSATEDKETNYNSIAVYDVNGVAGLANKSVPYFVRCVRNM